MTASPPDGPPANGPDIQSALAQWREALGAEHVRCDDETLDRYSRTCLPQSTRPCAVLCPGSTDEVAAAAKIATENRASLYPISRGKNWGYGAACAPTDGQAIVDLGRMSRIVEVDPTLAYAVVEPGVTQRQLYDDLIDNDLPLMLDSSGAGPDASIVGNILDRGFGHTPYGDHMQTTCSIEVVLADGRVLRTGFGHYEASRSRWAFRYGIGPWLTGLFTQANFGIVTQVGMWLMPKPERFSAFFLTVKKDEDIGPLIDALRGLKLQGILQSAVHVGNDLRSVSSTERYPYDLTGGRTPLSAEARAELRRRNNLGAWNIGGGIYGTRKQVAAHRSAIRKALRRFGWVHFLDEFMLGFGHFGVSLLNKFGMGRSLAKMLRAATSISGLLQGEPNEGFFQGALWRVKGETESLDPLDNNCGLMWLSPVIPMTGEAALDLVGLTEPIYDKHGFEFMITMTLITPRALCCVMSISYDRLDDEETGRAAACYDELFETVMKRGYVPYRCSIRSMPSLAMGSTVHWDVVRGIKSALDPHNVIAPGRYAPGEDAGPH